MTSPVPNPISRQRGAERPKASSRSSVLPVEITPNVGHSSASARSCAAVTRPARNTKLRMGRRGMHAGEVCLISWPDAQNLVSVRALVPCGLRRACRSTSRNHPSAALRSPQTTTLGRIVADSEDGTPRSLSGIRLLISGEEAFDSLIALADHAERTLDIQYYIIHQDESARDLAAACAPAPQIAACACACWSMISTPRARTGASCTWSEHANIEVRVFNPFPGGRSAIWSRILTSISDIPRINHRMHNKLFVADNAIAITGGRNIGDEYFTRDKHSNFIDLDVVAAGPIVPQLSASFDAFWNSKYAYPIASLAVTRAGANRSLSRSRPMSGASAPGRPHWLGQRARCAELSSSTGCRPPCSRTGPPRSRARPRPTKK